MSPAAAGGWTVPTPQAAAIQAGAGAQGVQRQLAELLLSVPQLGRSFRQCGHPLAAARMQLLQHRQHFGPDAVAGKSR